MQLEDRPLELEESELFDEEEDMRPAGGPPSSQLHALGGAAGAHPNQAGESDSDDDGIVLELESDCSSSGGQQSLGQGSVQAVGHMASLTRCVFAAVWKASFGLNGAFEALRSRPGMQMRRMRWRRSWRAG